MATRYAVANGNWSNVATWDGGASLPGVGDDVYANGYTVTIDQDITVNKIANHVQTPAVAGGKFEITANVDRILNCEINRGITIDCLVIQSTCTTNTITINGNLKSTGFCVSTLAIVLSYSSGAVIVNGDITSNAYISWGFAQRCGGATVTINGNIISVNDNRVKQVEIYATLNTGVPVILNYNGIIQNSNSIGIDINSHCILNTTGTILGLMTASNAYGSITINNGTVTGTINSTVNGYGYYSCLAVPYCLANTIITFNNNTITGGSTWPTLYNVQNNCIIRLNNVTVVNTDATAICSSHLEMIGDTNIYWQFNDGIGGNNTLYSEDNTAGVPAITDVRLATVYGAGGGLTGTLAVPPAAAVGIGVPVDNTVGTAAITAADMQNAILGKVADGTYTIEDLIKIMAAIMAGKTTITDLGGGLATVTFRNLADTINKVVADMDHSERTNLTIS